MAASENPESVSGSACNWLTRVTGYQLWLERFDREIEDIFAIQDEIARSVLESLGLALSEREEFRFLKPSTSNIEAYEAYLRGRKLYHKWTRQSVEFARQMFERAVKIDPNFAAAWAGLASTYVDLFRWGRKELDLEEAQRASQHALQLDRNSAEAHVSVGQALAIQRRFLEAAIAFDRAIKEDPTLFEPYYLYGRLLFESGDVEKAVKMFEKAQAARPDDFESRVLWAQALTELGRRDEARRANEGAVESIEKHLELNPDEARAYSLGASVLIRLGQTDRSKQWTQQAMTLAPNDPLVLSTPRVILRCSAKPITLSMDWSVQSKPGLLSETGSSTTRMSIVSAIIHAFRRS